MSGTKLPAIIMAGGRATRMGGREKALVKVGGITMLERVASAARKARRAGDVTVACTSRTPKTIEKAKSLGLTVTMTRGEGYVEDMRQAVVETGAAAAVVLNADLPFLTPNVIDEAIIRYLGSKKPALSIVVKSDEMVSLGFRPSYSRDGLAPAGVNVVGRDALTSNEAAEERLISNDAARLVNVNTEEQVGRANRMVRGRRGRPDTSPVNGRSENSHQVKNAGH